MTTLYNVYYMTLVNCATKFGGMELKYSMNCIKNKDFRGKFPLPGISEPKERLTNPQDLDLTA